MAEIIHIIYDWVWSPPLLILLLGTGLYYTFILKGLQWRKIGYAFKQLFAGTKGSNDGDISAFQALMTSLSATVGTSNIVGVAAALSLGGPGALFWMWVTALLGMSLKYAEAVLGVHFREVDANGNQIGGPMYYIRNGMGKRWVWLGTAFAIFGAIAGFGIGNTFQANVVAIVLSKYYEVPHLTIGIVIAVLVALVILGGIRSIGKIASTLVPLMAVSYFLLCIIVILANITQIPSMFGLIIESAFTPVAAQGGFVGATIMIAIQTGVSRSIFSNEAGLGSASIAHAAAKTDSPVRQGCIAMLGTFIDTIILCSCTGFMLLLTGAWTSGLDSDKMSAMAALTVIPHADIIILGALVLLAFTTIIGWSYYSERCCVYLFGERSIVIFRWLWVLAVPVGATVNFGVIWTFANILNGLMILPNLIALLLLAPVVVRLSQEFFNEKLGGGIHSG